MVWQFIFTTFTVLFICLNGFKFTNGEFEDGVNTNSLIIVDALSQNGVSSIQAAIDAVPPNNRYWVTIQVKAGTYNEQVKIPGNKRYIHLKGEGVGKSNIVWGATGIMNPAFETAGNHILVTGITFTNSYNYPPNTNKNPVIQAVAAKITGDKTAFFDCSFLGYQDTLWDAMGRHYFVNCIIEGAIDFIFGNGRSIYQGCTITVNAKAAGGPGYITAQGRESLGSGGGFIFKECSVNGNNGGKAYLGRAWRSNSFVLFYDSYLSDVVVPEGWVAWNHGDHKSKIIYAEDQCRGPGSDKSKRVRWEFNLPAQKVKDFTNINFIDPDGWTHKLPGH